MKSNWAVCLGLVLVSLSAAADYLGEWTQTMALAAGEESSVLLLDVRSEREYAAGRVPGAKNIPYDELDVRLAELAQYRGKKVVLYCHSGRRAEIARSYLSEQGFTKLYHLTGDMQAWTANGLVQSRSD